MSRVYFHARHAEAELRGSERAWLHHLAEGPAMAAWDLDRAGDRATLERLAPIMAAIPEPEPGEFSANHLHVAYRAALAADDHPMPWVAARKFLDSLALNLRVFPPGIVVAGHTLRISSLNLNTALVAGSDPIRLAAKIHGWCEIHCWVEDEDRAWLADVIDEGLGTGLYRPDAGWDDVQALLRDGHPSPVVLSFSGSDPFPEPHEHPDAPAWPDGVERRWSALDADRRAEQQSWEVRHSEMCDTDFGAAFDAGVDWLRAHRPGERLSPDLLGTEMFGPPVTVYDLFAPDRDERMSRACEPDATGGAP
mgnify:CR=1 FL=1